MTSLPDFRAQTPNAAAIPGCSAASAVSSGAGTPTVRSPWSDSVTVTSSPPARGVTNWVSRSSVAATATVRPSSSPKSDVSRLSIERCPCQV